MAARVLPLEAPASEQRRQRKRGLAYSNLLGALDGIGSTRRWSVEGAWEGAPLVVLAAPEKSGKTWTHCDLARAVITGGTWLGVFMATVTGSVVFIEDENGDEEIARRMARLSRGAGQDPREVLSRLRHYYAADFLLSEDNEAFQKLCRDVHEDPPAAILMGPFRNLIDGDENNNSDVIAALTLAAHLRNVGNCAVVIDHHLNKGGSMTGARAMKTRADLFIEGTDAEEPLYRAKGRKIRARDRIAKAFSIEIEHENDDDDTTATTATTVMTARFEGETPDGKPHGVRAAR